MLLLVLLKLECIYTLGFNSIMLYIYKLLRLTSFTYKILIVFVVMLNSLSLLILEAAPTLLNLRTYSLL